MADEFPIVAAISNYLDMRSQVTFVLAHSQACRMIGLERLFTIVRPSPQLGGVHFRGLAHNIGQGSAYVFPDRPFRLD
jgi:hypothetical protein